MKKFRLALLSFLMLCFAPVLVACDSNVEQIYRVKIVEFTEENIAMSVDSRPYQLEWEIEDNVALNQKVNFTSSRPEVATVSETGLVTPVSTGVTVISVSSEDNPKAKTNTCTVRVLPLKQTLATPTNLKYDATTGELSWDKVVENTNGDLIVSTSSFVPKYELSLTAGGETQTKVVSTNVYSELEAGYAYTISVKALGNEYLYDNSAASTSLNVHVLEAPKNLKVNVNKNYATLATGDDIAQLYTQSTTVANRSYTLSFDIPTNGSTSVADYNITLLNDRAEEVNAETKDILNDLISQATISQGKFTMPISGLLAGDYFFRINAKGDQSTNKYASSFVQTKRIKVLPTPTNLVLSGDNKQILSWNSVSFATGYQVLIEYKHSANDAEQLKYKNIFVKSGQYSSFDLSDLKDDQQNKFVKSQYTVFNVYMFALGNDVDPTQTMVLDSARSLETARAQLDQVKNINLSNSARTTADDINLSWSHVTNAGSYKVVVYKEGNEIYSQNVTTEEFTIDRSASWLQSGLYTLKITAIPAANQNYTKSVESQGFDFTKLASTQVSTTNGVINWTRVEGVTQNEGYELHYKLNNQQAEEVVVKIAGNKTSYDFGEEVYSDGNYIDFYIVAKANGTNAVMIDSEPSAKYVVNKLKKPNSFGVVSGELVLNDTVGTGTSAVTYASFALKVFEQQNSQNVVVDTILTTETTNSLSDQLKTVVSKLQKDVVYTFRLVALKPSNTNTNTLYVKSSATDSLVMISSSVQNLRTVDGVVTFDMSQALLDVVSQTIGTESVLDSSILNNIKYVISNNKDSTTETIYATNQGTISTTSNVTLQNITGGSQITVGIKTVFENAENPTICILNSDVVYATFTKLPTVVFAQLQTGGETPILQWNKIAVDGLKYVFTISHGSEAPTTVTCDTTTSDLIETNGNYNQIDLKNLIGEISGGVYNIEEGTYTISAVISPKSVSAENYVVSNKSQDFAFKKLQKPVLSVTNNYATWTIENNISGLNYTLVVDDGTDEQSISNISNRQYDLSNFFGKLDLKVKAVSTQNNIISSDFSAQISVAKLKTAREQLDVDKVSGVDVTNVLDDGVSWTFANYLVLNGDDAKLLTTKFAYSVASEENQSKVLNSGEIEVSNGKFTYTMPQTTAFPAGAYVLTLTPLASGAKLTTLSGEDFENSGVSGFVDGDSVALHIYKMAPLSSVKMEDGNLVWSKETTDFATIETQYSITPSNLNTYVYIAKAVQKDSEHLTIKNTDQSGITYTYSVPMDDLTSDYQFVIPLQKLEYATNGTAITADDGGIIQTTLNTGDFSFNYIPVGTTFSLYISTNANTKTVNKAGTNYYVLNSNPTYIKNITLLDTPNVQFNDGIMSWTAAKTNFDKIEFTFKKYEITGSTALNGGKELVEALDGSSQPITEVVTRTGYNVRTFDLSTLFDANDTTSYYVVTVQSIGNGKTTISSKAAQVNYVIGHIGKLMINTTLTNGWYVEDGAIKWNKVSGAKYYYIKFDQLRENSDTIVTNSQEIRYNATNAATYTYIPDSEMRMKGRFLVSMRAVGDVYNNAHADAADQFFSINGNGLYAVYANSASAQQADPDFSSAAHIMRQLNTNETMTVTNGELEWENSQIGYVTKYQLNFIDYYSQQEKTSALISDNVNSSASLTYIVSTTDFETSTYGVSLRAIGSTWTDINQALPDDNVVYLTSRVSSNYRFRYVDKNDLKLYVTNGLFNWKLDAEGTVSWEPSYSVGVKGQGESLVWLDSQVSTSNELSDYDDVDIDNLYIKVVGTQNAIEDTTPILNSNPSSSLDNIKKLPNFANYSTFNKPIVINEIGDLVWNYGYNQYEGMFKTAVSVKLINSATGQAFSQGSTQTFNASLSADVTYNYDDASNNSLSLSPKYHFDVNIVGSETYNNASEITYLSSNAASIEGLKFGSISNFTISNGVNMVWDTRNALIRKTNEGLTTISVLPTKYLLEYVSMNDENQFDTSTNKFSENAIINRIMFDAKAEDTTSLYNKIAQFVGNGNYAIRLSVLKQVDDLSEQDTFRSSPVYCYTFAGNGDLTYEITFNAYDGFDYNNTDGKGYFEISSESAFKKLRFTLDVNVIGKDLTNATTSVTGTTFTISNYDVALGANYKLTSSINLNDIETGYLLDNLHNNEYEMEEENLVLNGVFDGGSYTISNIQTRNSGKLAWFDQISTTGILKDLTLSYSAVELDFIGWSLVPVEDDDGVFDFVMPTEITYFGFVTNTNYGKILNCNVVGGDVVSDEYFESTNNIVLGGIAGQNMSTTENNVTTRAQIIGCSYGIDIPLDKNLKILELNEEYDQLIRLGGIVGLNSQSDVVNCENHGTLNAYQVGGIAYLNQNGGLISGCKNYANLQAQSTQTSGAFAIGAGIVAINNNSNIVYCLNAGNINGRSRTTNPDYNRINIAGIVGQIGVDESKTAIVSNCAQTHATTPYNYGLHVDYVGGQSGVSSWNVLNIGYIMGDYDVASAGSMVINNCAYMIDEVPVSARLDGESDEEYAARLERDKQYYARYICGSESNNTTPAFATVYNLEQKANALSMLNISYVDNLEEVVYINDDFKPVFVSTDDGIEMILIDTTSEYSQLKLTDTQTTTLALNLGFEVKLADDSAFNLTTISYKPVKYEIFENGNPVLTEEKPTTAGTYNVYVYYTLDQSYTTLNADVVIKYTYVLNEE